MSAVTDVAGNYESRTSRNRGFVTPEEQSRLRDSSVFVCGIGGMGGAAVDALVREGVGRVGIADPDTFEPSNLNRQPFATRATIGHPKTTATRAALLERNPDLEVEIWGPDWLDHVSDILSEFDVVINGMDDLRAGVALYRAAARSGTTIVDAYPCPHPSVTVVRPTDPRPEERLGFPTVGIPIDEITDASLREALLCEVAYVSSVSRGIGRIDPEIVSDILAGLRPRSSFAPVVVIAGNLMAFEATNVLLGRKSGAGHRGYFIDLWTGRVERPAPTADRFEGEGT